MSQKEPQQGQKRILVVDDEPELTMVCSLALQYHGFKVDTSNDSQESL
jgi:DNA-binding response OmpR family regulator